jgi:hypothetical protein
MSARWLLWQTFESAIAMFALYQKRTFSAYAPCRNVEPFRLWAFDLVVPSSDDVDQRAAQPGR